MNVITRGIRNAFRNSIRTLSIVIILGISIGLSLTMLLARQAVQQKINDIKSSVANTISISPAGFSGFSSVNNSLTTSELSKVSSLPHVTGVVESLTDRLTTIGSSTPSFPGQSSSSSGQTSLTSPVTINLNGGGSGSRNLFVSGGGSLPTNFTPPVSIVGTTDTSSLNGNALTITSGKAVNGTTLANDAMISKSMASKNNLQVGSTFTAYGTTLTVTGIFTVSNETSAGTVVVSLPTEQSLSTQTGDITSAVATVDSINNLSSVTNAIKNTLGSSTADVTSSLTQANNTVAPLNSVKNISLFSLIGSVIAGALIILLVMVMIVRERRKEIGVLKAIGGSNLTIISQFIVEAVTLTVLGAVVGLIIGVAGGTPVTRVLVNSSTSSSSSTTGLTTGGPRFGGGGGFAGRVSNNSLVSGVKQIKAAAGWSLLLYGFGAAILIAIIGSTLAAGLISKIRPAEVIRSE